MKKPGGPAFEFSAIGVVRSPFADRFGVPRQPGLAANANGLIKLHDDPDLLTAIRGLDEFSHLWIVFVFHAHGGRKWKPSIRPPRLGGAKKIGVLASRSPHRPNPIGLSAVALDRIDFTAAGGAEIHVKGLDLLDGTPVLDVKPYIPYADSIPAANAGWASAPIPRWPVKFSDEAEADLRERDPDGTRNLRTIAVEILELDPRPASQRTKFALDAPESQGLQFGIQILGCDFKYEIVDQGLRVTRVLVDE